MEFVVIIRVGDTDVLLSAVCIGEGQVVRIFTCNLFNEYVGGYFVAFALACVVGAKVEAAHFTSEVKVVLLLFLIHVKLVSFAFYRSFRNLFRNYVLRLQYLTVKGEADGVTIAVSNRTSQGVKDVFFSEFVNVNFPKLGCFVVGKNYAFGYVNRPAYGKFFFQYEGIGGAEQRVVFAYFKIFFYEVTIDKVLSKRQGFFVGIHGGFGRRFGGRFFRRSRVYRRRRGRRFRRRIACSTCKAGRKKRTASQQCK